MAAKKITSFIAKTAALECRLLEFDFESICTNCNHSQYYRVHAIPSILFKVLGPRPGRHLHIQAVIALSPFPPRPRITCFDHPLGGIVLGELAQWLRPFLFLFHRALPLLPRTMMRIKMQPSLSKECLLTVTPCPHCESRFPRVPPWSQMATIASVRRRSPSR